MQEKLEENGNFRRTAQKKSNTHPSPACKMFQKQGQKCQ